MRPSSFSVRQGFTLVELITTLAIIGILSAILVPVITRAREAAKQAACMSNVRELTLGLLNAAQQNQDQSFPKNSNAGSWAWDVNHSLVRDIAGETNRDLFYCPSSPTAALYSQDMLWTYFKQGEQISAVTSYVVLVPETPQIFPQYLNDRVRVSYETSFRGIDVHITANRRVLIVDGVLGMGLEFENIGGGLPRNVSNHMQGKKPKGAHAGYVDGHVVWRPFKMPGSNPDYFDFQPRSGSEPRFWF